LAFILPWHRSWPAPLAHAKFSVTDDAEYRSANGVATVVAAAGVEVTAVVSAAAATATEPTVNNRRTILTVRDLTRLPLTPHRII
jgi:hypothetical protein